MWKFFKSSISDKNKNLSSRKITAFVSFSLLTIGYLMQVFTGVMISPEFIYVFAGLAGTSLGLITWQNVIDLKNGGTYTYNDIQNKE